LGSQILGLIGSNGILPAGTFLDIASSQLGNDKYWMLPTLGWFSTSDAFLQGLCWVGVAASTLALVNIFPILAFFLCWVVYLSLTILGQEFLGFQWDALLLEIGFLAIFFSPLCVIPKPSQATPPSRFIHFLLKLLLFRVLFSFGMCKLLNGDIAWRNLIGLSTYYEMQPLPTTIGWYVHQLPLLVQKISTVGMFGVELIVPFFIFLNRRFRLTAYFIFSLYITVVILTGNFNFFNFLLISLFMLLTDDQFMTKFRLFALMYSKIVPTRKGWPGIVIFPVGIILLILALYSFSGTLKLKLLMFKPVNQLYQVTKPFHLAGSYGLFANLPEERREIVIEGSRDGEVWLPYEFKHKPGDLEKRPKSIAPHQPRLDWQLILAAQGDYHENPWVGALAVKLLEGSPAVLKLFEKNPFSDAPPVYIRAGVYSYSFTDRKTKNETGEWWAREPRNIYFQTAKGTGG
jgi:hypothetical protein